MIRQVAELLLAGIGANRRAAAAALARPAAHADDDVYLSPHCDDVCFSLTGLVRTRGGGRLISLFTLSDYVEQGLDLPEGRAARISAVTAMRRAEDARFAADLRLLRTDLGLAEPRLCGRQTRDPAGAVLDAAALRGPLLAALADAGASAARGPDLPRPLLLCPAAIGGHANHLAALLVVAAALPDLERRFRVLFYEDLHYAADRALRREGLRRLFETIGRGRATRHKLPLGPAAARGKIAAMQIYASQFAAPPRSLAGFVPAAGGGPHEAVWEFAPEPRGGRRQRGAGLVASPL